MLNGSGESEHLDLFLNLGRKMLSLALSMTPAIGFPQMNLSDEEVFFLSF